MNIQKHLLERNKSLQIIYPLQGITIIQPKDFDGQQELIIRIANLKNQQVSWYLNEKLIHISTQSTLKLFLARRTHSLVIVGEDGNMDTISFNIE